MSKRKGLSLEEKRQKVLEVFTESADVFVLKVGAGSVRARPRSRPQPTQGRGPHMHSSACRTRVGRRKAGRKEGRGAANHQGGAAEPGRRWHGAPGEDRRGQLLLVRLRQARGNTPRRAPAHTQGVLNPCGLPLTRPILSAHVRRSFPAEQSTKVGARMGERPGAGLPQPRGWLPRRPRSASQAPLATGLRC
jgi:hypothetical protein